MSTKTKYRATLQIAVEFDAENHSDAIEYARYAAEQAGAAVNGEKIAGRVFDTLWTDTLDASET